MNHEKLSLAIALALAPFALSGCHHHDAQAQSTVFALSSPDLTSGTFATKFILNGFGCTGQNVSPQLVWSNVPVGTKSLSLQIHDPDAPTGSGFWHWGVYDMPAGTMGLAQGAGNSPATLPAGAYGGNTDFFDTGTTGGNGNYGGPCPPAGDTPHRYVFTLYALKVEKLGVDPGATAAMAGFMLNANALGKTGFTVYYGR